MEFRRAIQLAKDNPGTVLARDHDGTFVVRNSDGTLITDEANDVKSDDSAKSTSLLEDTILDLQLKLHLQESENSSLRKELDSTKNQLVTLIKKYNMVSKEELKRIESQELEERRSERHIVQCSCLGEVENCHFCYGRGTFVKVTDGFGNGVPL